MGKKKYSFLQLLFIFSITANAQVINIPDTNLKNALVSTNCAYLTGGEAATDVDANDNGEIEFSEAQQVEWLTLGSNAISDLTGLEAFINITALSVYDNPITSINVSALSHLRKLDVINTPITEINLCGTQVNWLWCYDSPNLQSLYLKNNVISSDLAGSSRMIPPPLHNFEFYNAPLLSYICYDEGEFPAIDYALRGNTTGVTLTTSCDANCSLSTENPLLGEFTLYPNPTSGIVNIEFLNNQSIIRVTINNLLGQTLMNVGNASEVDLSQLTKGTYLVTVETEQRKATEKIVKL